jgi:small-conductance mechanosensitive channel
MLVVLSTGIQAQENDAAGFSSRESINKRLESLQTEMAEVDLPANTLVDHPLQQLEVATHRHLEALEAFEGMVERAASANEDLNSWKGFDDPSYFSIQFVQDLHAQVQSLELEAQSTESFHAIIQRKITDVSTELINHQRKTRQLAENAVDAVDIEEKQLLELAIQEEELSARIQAEEVARLQLRARSEQALKTAVMARLKLARFQLDAALKKLRFTEDELRELQSQVEQKRNRLLKDIQKTGTGQQEAILQNGWKVEVLNIERDFWNLFHVALNEVSESRRERALTGINILNANITDWVEVVRLRSRVYPGGEAVVVGELLSEDDLKYVTELKERIEFAIGLLTDKGIEAQGLWTTLIKDVLAVWNSELYLVEQTGRIGGEKVTTFRAITPGKLFRLAVVLVVGWFLLRLFSKLIRRFISRWSSVTPEAAAIAGSWFFGIGLALLLIVSLNWVHIPFSAFAFLGGTLAIGIGFGAQTLLRNFISGLMLRFERPFKVGDLVEVEDFMGRIKHIGLRASTIKDFDGVETLVPNSALLENRVNNWTLGDTTLRAGVKIGVAYDTSTREVTRLLMTVAEKHGLVLARPEPEVRFEEFGDDAKKFSLLFWFDASQTQRDAITSDLRFMIDRTLSEADIVIAFPQRDIHFDESRPLQVEFTKSKPK